MADAPGVMEAAEEAAYELRCAESAYWTGSRLFIGMAAMAFAGVAFSYFYLRSVNSGGLWRPGHVSASPLLGTLIAGAVVLGALINAYGGMRLRRGSSIDWEVAAWTSTGLGILASGLQIWQLTRLGFYPGSSGYASVFVAWGPLNVAMCLVGAYWLETLAARAIRLRSPLKEDGGAGLSQLPMARVFRANLEGATYFWGFAAVISVIFWVLFYII